jgi:hypothetical protein
LMRKMRAYLGSNLIRDPERNPPIFQDIARLLTSGSIWGWASETATGELTVGAMFFVFIATHLEVFYFGTCHDFASRETALSTSGD